MSLIKAGGFVVVGGAVGTVGGVGLPGVSVPQLGWVDLSTAFKDNFYLIKNNLNILNLYKLS